MYNKGRNFWDASLQKNKFLQGDGGWLLSYFLGVELWTYFFPNVFTFMALRHQ